MNGETPPLLDAEILALLHDAIGEHVDSLIQLFLQETPKHLHEMQQALNSGDLTTIHRLAHSLKSSSANLGAMQISALAAELEHMVKVGETDQTALQNKLTGLVTSYDQTRTIFENL